MTAVVECCGRILWCGKPELHRIDPERGEAKHIVDGARITLA